MQYAHGLIRIAILLTPALLAGGTSLVSVDM